MGQAAHLARQGCSSCDGGCGDTATVKVDLHALAKGLAEAEANGSCASTALVPKVLEEAPCKPYAASAPGKVLEDAPCRPYAASASGKSRRWSDSSTAARSVEERPSRHSRRWGDTPLAPSLQEEEDFMDVSGLEAPDLPQPMRPPEPSWPVQAEGAASDPPKPEPQQWPSEASQQEEPSTPRRKESLQSMDDRASKASAMELLCRAQEERERAEEQRRTEQLERLKREREEVDRERWAEHERLQARMSHVASVKSQASMAKLRAQSVRERREAVEAFLVENGFAGVTAKRTKLFFFSTYALHVAAEKGDALMVQYLLDEGADPEGKNSAGRTAAQVAQRKNRDGSRDDVLRALGCGI